MATPDESLATENWPILCTFLPRGWKEMARSTGAFRRARDIPDAESLLRLLLMHVANGYSLAETAVRASHLGMKLSAVAQPAPSSAATKSSASPTVCNRRIRRRPRHRPPCRAATPRRTHPPCRSPCRRSLAGRRAKSPASDSLPPSYFRRRPHLPAPGSSHGDPRLSRYKASRQSPALRRQRLPPLCHPRRKSLWFPS